MAKKKLTTRQRDIERLAKDYQASVTGLEPEYQSVFEKKTEALSGYETKAQEYQKNLEDFQKSLIAYKENPMTQIGYLKPVKKSTDYYFTEDGKTKYLSQVNDNDYFFEGLTVYKKAQMPKFTEQAPVSPDTSAFDTELEQIQAKRKTLGEGFEREKAERKSSQLRAVSQRSRERPMLSKGVTL